MWMDLGGARRRWTPHAGDLLSMPGRYCCQSAVNLDPNKSERRIRYPVGTYLLRSGMNLRDIQALLGHADLQTTAGYLMADQLALEAAPSRLPW